MANGYYPDFKLPYSTDMVCKSCGSNEWHTDLYYNNRNGQWYMGSEPWNIGEEVWCQNCEVHCTLIKPNEFKRGE